MRSSRAIAYRRQGNVMKKTTLLRQLLEKKTLVAMGAYDAFSAMLVARAGIDVVYLSGYLSSAAFLGTPDLGLMTATERLAIAREMTRRVDVPVIADMEEGYGNALNVVHSVQQFEAAGLAGVHLDDEVFPTREQFYASIRPNPLISIPEMCGKIRAAVNARTDPDFLIMARSDVLGTVAPGTVPKDNLIKEIVERANAYAEAGADMIFVYAQTPEEIEIYARAIQAPLAGVLGYIAPFSIADFERHGYRLVICPHPVLGAGAKGILEVLKAFQQKRDWKDMLDLMLTHAEVTELVALKSYSDILKEFRE